VGHVVDARHLGLGLQKVQHGPGVAADAFHAQRQRFQPLQQQESRMRRQRGAGIAQHDGACTGDQGASG
jgi:hypothetical protein